MVRLAVLYRKVLSRDLKTVRYDISFLELARDGQAKFACIADQTLYHETHGRDLGHEMVSPSLNTSLSYTSTITETIALKLHFKRYLIF